MLAVVALSALALSVFALFQSRVGLSAAGAREAVSMPSENAAVEQMRVDLESLASQVRQLERAPAGVTPPYKAGLNLNLSKRSQALRMHRRGEPSAQIAAALDLPHQEVDLLIKIQRIVLSKL
jgi:hypothetical protein